jgi:hypothetical protein
MKTLEYYISELCDRDNRPENLEVVTEELDEDEEGSSLLHSKVEKAIKEMKDKASGHDDVPEVVLKFLGENGLKIITQLINNIYETGEWPKIVSKKKPEATKFGDHRTYNKESSEYT